MKDIRILMSILAGDVADYKTKYQELAKERDEKITEAKAKYNSTYLEKEISKINDEFTKQLTLYKSIGLDSLKKIDELREYEKFRVRRADKSILDKLAVLKDCVCSREELEVFLADEKIKGNYWAERFLSQIAKKSNVDTNELSISPALDKRLSILDTLEKHFVDTIMKFENYNTGRYIVDGSNEGLLIRNVYFSERMCDNVVGAYTNEDAWVSGMTKADEKYLNILKAGSEYERSALISNALRNNSSTNRNALLYRLATDDSLSETVKMMSGFADEINSFKLSKVGEYRRAMNGLESMRKAGSRTQLDATIGEIGRNQFFSAMCNEEIKVNSHLKEVVGDTPLDFTVTDNVIVLD